MAVIIGIKDEIFGYEELIEYHADTAAKEIKASIVALKREGITPEGMEFSPEDIRSMAISMVIGMQRKKDVAVPMEYHPGYRKIVTELRELFHDRGDDISEEDIHFIAKRRLSRAMKERPTGVAIRAVLDDIAEKQEENNE